MRAVDAVRAALPPDAVRLEAHVRTAFAADTTEIDGSPPDAVITVRTAAELQEVVRAAAAERVPLIPRVAGTNVGGLTIPARGGWVLDLTGMDRIVSIDDDDLVAVIEPGVTFGALKEALDRRRPPLTLGFPLSPPEASVAANCLLDGLGNLSLVHGSMGEWISGLEVVRADGTTLRTGAWALGVPVPFGRAPLPDLTGMFVSTQGTTGIVSKLALQLWPRPAHRWRAFILTYDRHAAMRALRELPRLGILDDLGALSWPIAKMLFGVHHPAERDPAEPELFLYADIAACTAELLRAKRRALGGYLAGLRRDGARMEDPIEVADLVALEPRLARLAEFPTRLDFLLDHPDGGLTWVGTYGPMSRFERGCDRGVEIVGRHGFAPIIVARPMKGGHFGVLRFIQIFRHDAPEERERARACNAELCDALLAEGFVMYKTPDWAVRRYRDRMDPGFARLLGEVRNLLDPDGLLNPGRWPLEDP
jgi:FAD/FMN-containing dehydrogenase